MSTEESHEIFWDKRLTLRCHPRTRLALRRAVARLSLDGGLRFQGEEATQEAIVNATWLALEAMDLREAVEWLAPFLRQIERLPTKEAAPADVPPPPASQDGRSQTNPPLRPPSRRKAGSG